MKITVNGGHYPGLDNGAVGPNGLQEVVVVGDVMEKVAQYLRTVGYDVLEVQESDLGQIVAASNEFGADLFIAVHCDSAENMFAQGTETFCDHYGGADENLAKYIQNQIVKNLGTVNRGIKKADFEVLRKTNCPAVLVELAFISNPYDESILVDQVKRDQFAAAIARGVTDYCAAISL
jgi:N-acetylmuramoyl-L-alanine amidase